MYTEDDLLPISSLQHLMFCERQWALIQLEGIWEENRLTIEGSQMHERVHEAGSESRPGVRIARGLRVRCLQLGLTGQCDVVEFRPVDHIEPDCGAGFQPAGHREKASKIPAPQEIADDMEPPPTLGSCVLGRADCAKVVQDALLSFEGSRYHLVAWCIMPNHVHVLAAPLQGHKLSSILHSWKSYTAVEINRLLGRKGALWERESFDHILRSAEHLEWFKEYIEKNPVVAGLCSSKADWRFGSCGAGFQPADRYEFVPAGATPYVAPGSRGELPHLHKAAGTYFVTFRLADAVTCRVSEPGRMPATQEEFGATAVKMPAPRQGGLKGQWSPFPIEYKRGKPKREPWDEVQLCAQAMCLEEMLELDVPAGAIFYGRTRRRHDVAFDDALRAETKHAAARLHQLFNAGVTPPARYEKKCDNCSLIHACMPKATGGARSAVRYLAQAVAGCSEEKEGS